MKTTSNGNRPSVISGITFAAVLTAVGCSRLFVRCTLKQWELDELIDTAELVVSELTGNSVKSTGITDPEPKWTELADLSLIHVRLLIFKNSLIIEVWDRGPRPPVIPEQSLDAEGGRGLFLVESLSRRWNYYQPPTGGKWVWCELEIPPTTGPLPRREQQRLPESARPIEPTNELETLRRVMDGLKDI